MNLNLGSNQTRHSNNTNTNDFDHMKEQQPVMNVIYENNNNDNSNSNVETSREHVFSSQLDSFEMDHIALQVRQKNIAFYESLLRKRIERIIILFISVGR